MLLVINANNTNTKFAVFDGDTMLNEWRIQTISGHTAVSGRTADEYAVWLTHLMALHNLKTASIDSCIISSVVPQTNFELKTLCRRYFKTEPLVLGEPGVKLGMQILLDRPQDAGADRIANAVGGFVALGRALIVVDFGTATTFDVVDDKGNYVGGVIAPGINLSVEALHMATAKLPRIAIERPAKIIGKDTLSAMQSGVFWGYIGLIEGLVTRIKREWGSSMEVIATGGLAPLFQGATTMFDHMMPDVTNRGLLEIWRRSQENLPLPLAGEGRGEGGVTQMPSAHPHPIPLPPAGEGAERGDLVFLPLGGSGEIGMNLNLYGLDGKWLMVDCGMGFAEPGLPGIELVVPDPSFIVERRADLLAIVLTHAHEDHLGAVGHLWPRLRCPIYATAFAAAILRRKLSEFAFADEVPIHQLDGGTLPIGPFTLDFIGLTHSIPEMRAVAIRTRHGTVLHTGDWKLDPDPIVGPVTDDAALRRLGDEGVLALICNSTNVLQPEASGSEAAVRDSLIELVGKARRRVVVTTFASNVARIAAVAQAARENHRDLAIVGRSLHRTIDAARETGYLRELPRLLDDEEAAWLPPDKALLLCTGCQGEPNGAMSRIAAGAHKHVVLERGDTAIFSSKIIPGNERALYQLYNRLAERGVAVLTEKEHFVHVSGHPGRPELEQLYRWARPRIAVPVHGEPRHLVEHVALAKRWQVPEAIMIENGSMLRLAPGPATEIGQVTAGRLAVDGKVLTPVAGSVLRARKKLAWNGAAVVTLVTTPRGTLAAAPRAVLQGVPDDDAPGILVARVEAALADAFAKLPAGTVKNDELATEVARRATRQVLAAHGGKRPPVEVQIIRLPG